MWYNAEEREGAGERKSDEPYIQFYMSNRRKHIHKYQHVGRPKVWACALPECSHFMPLNVEDQVIGKKSLCWGCGEAFILDDNNMKEDQPQCFTCSTGLSEDDLDDILQKKLKA